MKKLVSMCLALALCLGLTVLPAAAAETDDYEIFSYLYIEYENGPFEIYYGLKDGEGNILIPADTYIDLAMVNGILIAAKRIGSERYYGLMDLEENVILPFVYDNIWRVDGSFSGKSFYVDGYFLVQKDSLWGLVTSAGQVILEPQFSEIDALSDTLLKVRSADTGRWGVYDVAGRQLIVPKYAELYKLDETHLRVRGEPNGLWAICDNAGNELTPMFFSGLESLGDGYFKASIDAGTLADIGNGPEPIHGHYGVIDEHGIPYLDFAYSDILCKYKDTFVVEQFTDESYYYWTADDIYYNIRNWEGDLLHRQGVMGVDNSVVIPVGEYFELDVDEKADAFRCARWEGKKRVEGYLEGMPSYTNVYEYETVPYSDVVTTDLAANAGDMGLTTTVAGFTDVYVSDYYADAVAWAKDREITGGTTPTTFSPSATVTRAQAVTFLWRAAGEPEPASTASPFTDVTDSGQYYYKAVLWAAEQGIVGGVGNGQFSLDGNLSYEQILAMLCRAAGADASGADWSAKALSWAETNGLTDGLAFSAGGSCPRSDVVYCLWKQMA